MTLHRVRPARVAAAISFALAALFFGFNNKPARADEPAAIAWQYDYGASLEQARSSNRYLWIHFTGPWCPNCTRMERDSFSQPAIVEQSQRSFLPLKLRSDENEQLVAAFGLTAIPATVIVAPNRDVIAFHQGYLGPDDLLARFQDCLARHPLAPADQVKTAAAESEAREQHGSDAKPELKSQLALSGYCTVSLIEARKLVKGQAEHAVAHQGRTYRFGSLTARERFRQDPARYLPWNDGACPVTQFEEGLRKPGDARWGVLYAGRLFVCASEQNRRRFMENPGRYLTEKAVDRGETSRESAPEREPGA
jgi:YHS domain-containing protein/thioredoxin-related protein